MDTEPSNGPADMNGGVIDLLVIGGGVNGCGIARDAAGRGLSVVLCEKDDLAQATSSASTKLFHGGLRYLEYFEFRLVREALKERETLLCAMPHISWPLRFVLPIDPDLRYPDDRSALSKLLKWTMPFLRGRRPGWLIRAGLFVYDHLGGRRILPATRTLDLRRHAAGKSLHPKFRKAFEYSDCWIEDSRLVVLNARDAADKGASILTRTICEAAERRENIWVARLRDQQTGQVHSIRARGIVNAGGPWVEDILNEKLRQSSTSRVRLVRGSHIVTRQLFDHDQPYFFQLDDGRIIFAIPYEQDFTLIGTTEFDHEGDPGNPACSVAERDYLIDAAKKFFSIALTPEDVVWTYSGVRPLYDDNANTATAATRDYVLKVGDKDGQAPLLNVFGGKITTYRRLAESAMAKLAPYYEDLGGDWTAGVPLPGGDFPHVGVQALITRLRDSYPFLEEKRARRLIRAYGTDAFDWLGDAGTAAELGRDFGSGLTEAEVDWLMSREWACCADDILWRRSKLGLRLTKTQAAALDQYIGSRQKNIPSQHHGQESSHSS